MKINAKYIFLYSSGVFFELARVIVVLVVAGVLINYFFISIIPIKGQSMEPNFHSGDWALINKFRYIKGDPERGEVVGLRFPGDPYKERYIKRIIGLPGEMVTINNDVIYINNRPLEEPYIPEDYTTGPNLSITLKDNQYFLIGDNRENSSDSRIWGPASKEDIIGESTFILFPFRDYKYIGLPVY